MISKLSILALLSFTGCALSDQPDDPRIESIDCDPGNPSSANTTPSCGGTGTGGTGTTASLTPTRTWSFSIYNAVGDGTHITPMRITGVAGVTATPLFASLPVSISWPISGAQITGWRASVTDGNFAPICGQLYKTDGFGTASAIGGSSCSGGFAVRSSIGVNTLSEALNTSLSYEIRLTQTGSVAGSAFNYFVDTTN